MKRNLKTFFIIFLFIIMITNVTYANMALVCPNEIEIKLEKIPTNKNVRVELFGVNEEGYKLLRVENSKGKDCVSFRIVSMRFRDHFNMLQIRYDNIHLPPKDFRVAVTKNGAKSYLVYNCETNEGEVTSSGPEDGGFINIFYNFRAVIPNIIVCLISTIIIEMIIAKNFKIKNKMLVLIVNILTQIFLHTITIFVLMCGVLLYKEYILLVIGLELLIIMIEFLLYRRKIDYMTSNKLMIYCIVANAVTFIISPLFAMSGGLLWII